MNCLFCDIVNRKIKTPLVYEDEWLVGFEDIHPQAPIHCLIIARKHINDLNKLTDPALAGQLMIAATTLAKKFNLSKDGYRIVMNCNQQGGQTIYHIHMHLLGGRQMNWPPG